MKIACGNDLFFLGFIFPWFPLLFVSIFFVLLLFCVRVLVSDLQFFATKEAISSGSTTQVSVKKWEWKRRA